MLETYSGSSSHLPALPCCPPWSQFLGRAHPSGQGPMHSRRQLWHRWRLALALIVSLGLLTTRGYAQARFAAQAPRAIQFSAKGCKSSLK